MNCRYCNLESPVEKVISLLEDLKSETEAEGKAEAKTYDEFACFCKKTTAELTSAITSGQDNIEGLASTLQEQTALQEAKAFEMKEMDELIAKLDKEISKQEAVREKEKSRYEMQAADLQKGIDGLEGAISSLSAADGDASLAQVKATVRTVRASVLANSLLEESSPFNEFLLQEPEMNDGVFHSDALIETFEKLMKKLKARKTEVDQREGENAKDFAATMQAQEKEKTTAQDTRRTAESDKGTAAANIGQASDDTTLAQAQLSDDESRMKSTTEQCEMKAREWDQRSTMRGGEVEALSKAVEIIKGKVVGKDGKRALLQTPRAKLSAPPAEEVSSEALSFLQAKISARAHLAGLAKKVQAQTANLSLRRDKTISFLIQQSKQLSSPVLSALAIKMQADPFLKVKKLIQELIERLVKEAAEESSKKGWCDTEMGKATSNRNSNHNAVMTLDGELKALEAKKATLEEDSATLKNELTELNDALAKQTKLRSVEKAENINTLDESKAGMAATKDAYDVLKAFYNKAAKGAVSLVQAPYKGNSNAAGGIFAMLDVIISDFQRTIKVVTDSEGEAHQEFVEFERDTKMSIMSKSTGKSQAEGDLKTVDQKISAGMEKMQDHMSMLDDSLKELEDLKPECVDTGMSAAEKKAKREEEIDALKSALCQLDGEGVEPEC